MNEILNLLSQNIFSSRVIMTMIEQMMTEFLQFLESINWVTISKVLAFTLFSILMVVLLFLANEQIFNYFQNRRTKKHKLTVRNRGNVPSIFLFRTLELPKQLSVRFRSGGYAMIIVTHKPPEAAKKVQEKAAAPEQKSAESTVTEGNGSDNAGNLIPDLNKPMDPSKKALETVGNSAKAVGRVGKKFGLLAGILGSISSLLPKRVKGLNEAQAAFKGVQQDANSIVGNINQKAGGINTLSNQVGNLLPDSAKEKAAAVKNDVISELQDGTVPFLKEGTGTVEPEHRTFDLKDFSCDEDIWMKQIGKTDLNDGSLVYAQSKILNPGESMQIDVELMNFSESNVPVSFMYKIEVLQIPQTRIPLAAPRQYISGVVSYERISRLTRILPLGIVTMMMIIALQLIAGLSHLLF